MKVCGFIMESINFDKISLLNKIYGLMPRDLRPEKIDGSICLGRPTRAGCIALSASVRRDGFRIDCIQTEKAGDVVKYSIVLTNPDRNIEWREDYDEKGPHRHFYVNGVEQPGHPRSSGSIEEIVSGIVNAIRSW